MGRRALRKIDPELDLSRHFHELPENESAWTPLEIFSCTQPLELEIGSGKGLFLRNAAEACAEHNFVGIEVAGKYAKFAAAGLARSGLKNACMLHGDARRLVQHFMEKSSVHRVHIYFPDPWWKARHHKRRIMAAEFLRQVERILVPSGRLVFWTDVEAYFQESLEILSQATTLRGPIAVPENAPAHDLDYRTHFERKKRKEQAKIFRAEFEKPSVDANQNDREDVNSRPAVNREPKYFASTGPLSVERRV